MFVQQDSPVVEGEVDGVKCCITVDTGSNISIVRSDLVKQDTAAFLENCWMKTVTGEKAPVLGKKMLQLAIGPLQVQHEMWVADITDECLLGTDFLEPHGCLVDFRDSKLLIGTEEVPFRKSCSTFAPSCCRIILKECIDVPPRSEAVVMGKVEGSLGPARWGLVEPKAATSKAVDGVLIGRTLVDLEKEAVPMRLMNISDIPHRIKKGTELAFCEPVYGVSTSDQCGGGIGSIKRTQAEMRLPDHVRELYERSIVGLDDTRREMLYHLLCEFSDLFSQGSHDLGRTDLVKHHINTGSAAPVRQPPRRLPLAKREEADKAIEEMKADGIIEPSASPWSSPVVLVKKKDGTLRFCVDYRKLNSATRKDSYPLPRIDDTLEALAGSKWFSTLDLKSGYWQVELDKEDREKTAFSAGNGLWQFTVMPFGLCNAPATFERLMEQVLAGLPITVALVYLDDVLVPGVCFIDHLSNLRQVFSRLQKARLKLSPKKCVLFQKEVDYLGHVVNKDGISTDPQKIEAIASWPAPGNASEVKSFIGLCSYYRRYIQSFSDIASPLYQCAEKKPFSWTQSAEAAFVQLKQLLTSAPVLAYPKPGVKFILDTDASNNGIGAVLSQLQDGQERVIAYFSRSLNRAESQYCVTRKELLAMVKAVRHFHCYLYGRHFLLRTDHAALRWLLNFKAPEGQVARWLEQLQQYDFDVQHRPGAVHSNADALSRRPCLYQPCNHCDRLESRDHHHGRQQGAEERDMSCQSVAINLDFHNLTTTSLRQAQEQDEDIRPVILWLERSATRPRWEDVAPQSEITKAYWAQWNSLKLLDGVLYRLWENASGDKITKQLVIPKNLRSSVLHLLHNLPTSGHMGVAKTVGRIKERFYWVNVHKDVQNWCKNCDLCASRRGPPRKIRAPLSQYNAGSPMERIAVDVLGPLPTSEDGNKYLLIAADYFTKWVEGYALPNQEAVTVADVLVKEFVCRFGVPLFVHSDQGRNFESAVFGEMCRLLGISKTRTTPLHPQSDGMVERFNRTIESQLSKYVEDHQRDWDKHIPFLLMAYRTSVHEATGHSPSQLMLGRHLRLPIDLLLERPEGESPQLSTAYAERLLENLEDVHRFARKHLQQASDKMKERYDSSSQGRTLERGDAVWLFNPQRKKGVTPKLMRNWKGPYTVVKRINDVVYRIQLGPRTKPKVVHRNRLWEYSGESPPTWLQTTNKHTQTVGEQTAEGTITKASPSLPENSNKPSHPASKSNGSQDGRQCITNARRSNRKRKPPERYGQN